MRAQITGIFLVFASASIFAADATPATNTPAAAVTSTEASSSTATAAASIKDAETGPTEKARASYYGYRLVQKEGVEDKYCRKQKVTGSRTKVIESCLTLEEITALRENGQDMLNRARGIPGMGGGLDSNGGMTNSVISPMQ